MMAYSSVHESTGETPNMLSREEPLDVIIGSTPDTQPFTTEYTLALQRRLVSAREVVR